VQQTAARHRAMPFRSAKDALAGFAGGRARAETATCRRSPLDLIGRTRRKRTESEGAAGNRARLRARGHALVRPHSCVTRGGRLARIVEGG